MARRKQELTKSQQRLLHLFKDVEDKDIQEVMYEVVSIAGKYRSSSKERFPVQQIRDVVDSVARRQEIQEE